MTLIGYARVPAGEWSSMKVLAWSAQFDALIAAGVAPDRLYRDECAGVRADRPGLVLALDGAVTGDVVVVWRLDRFGCGIGDLVALLNGLFERGVAVRSLRDEIRTDQLTPGRLLAALRQSERDLATERETLARDAARANGRLGGRAYALSPTQVRQIRRALAGRVPGAELARAFGVGRATIYRAVDRKDVP